MLLAVASASSLVASHFSESYRRQLKWTLRRDHAAVPRFCRHARAASASRRYGDRRRAMTGRCANDGESRRSGNRFTSAQFLGDNLPPCVII